MRHYSFLQEDQQVPLNDPAIDPNAMMQQPQQGGADQQVEEFEPLIKSIKDVPHSKEKADTLLVAAKIREIEAKTKETLAKANNPDMMGGDPSMMDPNMGGGQIDPATGMPMDPNMGAQIDPMTGQPVDPNVMGQQQDNGPLKGLGDATAPQDPMGGMGAVDPMTGMPTNEPSKSFTAVGRAYKLKKIYDILDKISYMLHTTPDTKLQEISKQVDEAFELFRLVVNNLKLYKDQVDDLIVMYYSLLKDICDNIEDVYKERKLESSVTESKKVRRDLVMLGEGIEE